MPLLCECVLLLRLIAGRERMRLDIWTRERVVLLKKQGYTYREIAQRLKEENIFISIKSLYLSILKYRYTNSVVDKPRQSQTKLLNREHYFFIDNQLSLNDELTTRQLHNLLVQEFPQLCVSSSTVKRARYEPG